MLQSMDLSARRCSLGSLSRLLLAPSSFLPRHSLYLDASLTYKHAPAEIPLYSYLVCTARAQSGLSILV